MHYIISNFDDRKSTVRKILKESKKLCFEQIFILAVYLLTQIKLKENFKHLMPFY